MTQPARETKRREVRFPCLDHGQNSDVTILDLLCSASAIFFLSAQLPGLIDLCH
jgi:hypothetical protein